MAQDVSGFFEHIIPYGMPIMVVDVLKVIHIHNQSSQFFSFPQFRQFSFAVTLDGGFVQ